MLGLVGTTAPDMRPELGIGYAEVALLYIAQTAGMVAGAFAVGISDRRLVRPLPMALIGAAALVAGMVGWFPGLVVAMALAGVSVYAINARAQAELSRLAGPRRARALSLFHLGGGAGAFLAPLAIAALLDAGVSWRGGFALVAASLLLYAPWAAGWGHGAAPRVTLRPGHLSPGARWALVVAVISLGIQNGVPLWLAQLMHDAFGISVAGASAVTAVYMAGLFLSRLGVVLWLPRLGEARVLAVCACIVVAGLLLLGVASTAAVAIAASGLVGGGVGPILALAIARLAVLSDDRLATSAVMGGGAVAGILLPALTVALEPLVGLQWAVAAYAVPAAVAVLGVRRSAPRDRVP